MIPTLFTGLCDDAALFPPANASVAQAVPAHREHRAAWYSDLVGPFLATAKHLPEVAKTARDADALIALVLVVPQGPGALAAAIRTTMGEPGIELVGVELACGPEGSSADATRQATDALARELPEGVRGVIEVSRGDALPDALDVLASNPYRAKYRTGGTVASAFPAERELADFIAGCATRSLAFKCTAGLHQATRHTDPTTGFEHHGFLNILAATHIAGQGANVDDLIAALRTRSGRELADQLRHLTPEAAARTRRAFTAYGTCSIAEPLAELSALGLISHSDH